MIGQSHKRPDYRFKNLKLYYVDDSKQLRIIFSQYFNLIFFPVSAKNMTDKCNMNYKSLGKFANSLIF